MFGQAAGLAHAVEDAFEHGLVGQMLLIKPEQAHEGLVPETQGAIRAKAGHASREAVEQVALSRFKAAVLDAGLFKLILVHCETGDAGLAKRHIDDPHRAAFAIYGRWHHAFDHPILGQRLLC